MDEFTGLAIVLFVVLTLFAAMALRLVNYWKRYSRVRPGRARLSSEYPALKSGDIILFVAHVHGLTNSLFSNDFYSHGGMVVDGGDGGLFLSEATEGGLRLGPAPDDVEPSGAAVLPPLLPRLKYYPGATYLMSLRHPLSPAQEGLLRERAAQALPYPSAFQMLKAVLGLRTEWQGRHCMQHLAWLVDELGLTPLARAAKGETLLGSGFFASSRAITTLGGEALGGGNSYAAPVELLYDVGL